jgi:hypothetical protein
MHTKSRPLIAIWLLILTNTGHGQEITTLTALSPLAVHNARVQEVQNTGSSSSATLMLDRGGMDKASVHLQIFQQTSRRLADSLQTKKLSADNKRHQVKLLGNG